MKHLARFLLLIVIFFGAMLHRAKAQEYTYDSSLDVFVGETFVVNGNDPGTYDYWGEFINDLQFQLLNWANQQLSAGLQAIEQEIATNISTYQGQWMNQLRDSMDGFMNVSGGWGLMSPQNLYNYLASHPGIAGYVISNGNGGYTIIVDTGKLTSVAPGASANAMAVIEQSVRVHEGTHVSDAVAANPTIFTALLEGWGLGPTASGASAAEVRACDAQINYLNDQIANNTSLTSADINVIDNFLSNQVEAYRAQNGG